MSRETFRKSDRLLTHNEFVQLFQHGDKLHYRLFIVVFRRGCQKDSRLGVTVSKKVGNAVTRNRIKRRIREFFRKTRDHLHASWDIHVIAKKNAAGASWETTCSALHQIVKQISIHANR